VRAVRSLAEATRPGPGVAAIALLAVSWALMMHTMGWAQTAHFAQVRAFHAGQPEIDPWHWETKDKAWVDGHFYSVKAPGLAALSTPLYSVIEAVGGSELAERAALRARAAPRPKWTSSAVPPYRDHGFSAARAEAVETEVERNTPIVWALGLFGAVLPALALLLLVRWVANRFVPGYGSAAALTLGLATILMTFAAEYFSHVIATTLGFGAFALLLRERDEPAGRLLWVAGAGLLAGLAISFEFPVGLVGVALFAYALGSGDRLRRGGAYLLGAIVGVLPVFAFNAWALGSPFEFAYGSAVAVQGLDGHASLGLNDDGLFGITVPKPGAALDLLLASRGLLVLTPVIAAALAGLVLMRRAGHRAELAVIAAVAAAYLIYNAGYWLPFGGGTPGPRFLIPALPFVAIGFAYAYRRLPATTLALAIPSAVMMLVGSITFPLVGDNGTGIWGEKLYELDLEHTLFTVLGVSDPVLALVPVLTAIVAAVALGFRSVPATSLEGARGPVALLAGWLAVAVVGPTLVGDVVTPLERPGLLPIVAAAGLLAVGTLGAIAYRQRDRARRELRRLEPALSDRIS
jgi:hypothetical protein